MRESKTLPAFRRWLKRKIQELDTPESDLAVCDGAGAVVQEAAATALVLGLPDLYRLCQFKGHLGGIPSLGIGNAREILAGCLAGLPATAKPTGGLLTVTEVARRLQVNRDKVLGWIHYNRLRAVNTAKGSLGRPRWRIKPADLDDFLAGRTGQA